MSAEATEEMDLIPSTDAVRYRLARCATEAARLRRLLQLAVRRDREQERLRAFWPGASRVDCPLAEALSRG
jgi:hypothetical protein